MTAKEKVIHTQGRVGVLKDLHDEPDAAVLQAYGWPDLSAALGSAQREAVNSELPTRLVALNAQRSGEEKAGRIRWLRRAFQNPVATSSLLNKELHSQVNQGLQADLVLNVPARDVLITAADSNATQSWPAALPEQVRAVALVLASATDALPLPAIEARFKGRGPWKKSLPRILDTLEALGRARREREGWRSKF